MEKKIMKVERIAILIVAIIEMIVSIEIYSLINTIRKIADSTYIEIECKNIEDGKCIVK